MRAFVVALLSTLLVPALAAAQTVLNGDFEQSVGFDVPGWVHSGSISTPVQPTWYPGHGNVLAFNGGQNPPNGVLSQAISTLPGQAYTLAFDFGAYSQAVPGTSQSILVEIVGASLLAAALPSDLASHPATLEPYSLPFVADGPLTQLIFRDNSLVTTNVDGAIDNVVVTGPGAPRVPVLQLSVEYSVPSTVFGPISFGLFALPDTFTAIFTLPGYIEQDNVTAGLGDVALATVRFGDGLWTSDLTSFTLVTDASGEVTTLSYATGQVITPTAVGGPIINDSFSATVAGTHVASDMDFEYLYAASEQSITVGPTPPPVPALPPLALAVLAGWILLAAVAARRSRR